jgi:hypothetical protein
MTGISRASLRFKTMQPQTTLSAMADGNQLQSGISRQKTFLTEDDEDGAPDSLETFVKTAEDGMVDIETVICCCMRSLSLRKNCARPLPQVHEQHASCWAVCDCAHACVRVCLVWLRVSNRRVMIQHMLAATQISRPHCSLVRTFVSMYLFVRMQALVFVTLMPSAGRISFFY